MAEYSFERKLLDSEIDRLESVRKSYLTYFGYGDISQLNRIDSVRPTDNLLEIWKTLNMQVYQRWGDPLPVKLAILSELLSLFTVADENYYPFLKLAKHVYPKLSYIFTHEEIGYDWGGQYSGDDVARFAHLVNHIELSRENTRLTENKTTHDIITQRIKLVLEISSIKDLIHDKEELSASLS